MRKSIGFLTTVFLVLLLACPSNAGKIYPLGSSSASGIYFDNTTASLSDDPVNVQAAIEAIKTEMGSLEAGGLADIDDLPGDTVDDNKVDFGLLAGVQPLDADLTTWAGVTSSANGRSLVSAADYSAMRTLLGLRPGTEVQAYDADLTSYAGVTPNANALTLLGHDFAGMRTDLGLVIGTNVLAYDYDTNSLSAGIVGLLKGSGNGGGYAAASAGTDYLAPNGNGSQLTNITTSQVGAVPSARTVNSKALSSDISLTAADVGAAATSHNQAESTITFTNITTGNASTTAHGFLPVLDDNAAHFLNGKGAWVAGGGGASTMDDLTDVTATHTTGGILYDNGSEWVVLPKGAAGTYLKTGDTPSWDTPDGAGDMLASVYDTNSDNVVDNAATLLTKTWAAPAAIGSGTPADITGTNIEATGTLKATGATTLSGALNVTGTTTLATALSGIPLMTSGVISAATPGTHYVAPSTTVAGHALSGNVSVADTDITATADNRLIFTTASKLSELAAITGSRALASDANGLPVASATTATELGYVNGVTSALQTQLNAKAPAASPTFTGTVTMPTGLTGIAYMTSGVLSAITDIPTADTIGGQYIYRAGGTDIPVTDGGTGRSTGTTAYSLIATGTTATGAQQTLANGATTEILVGGGASALPVWTTGTGTGAPVRAGSPTFTTQITTPKVYNAGDITIDAYNNAANSTVTITNSSATYKANLVIEGSITSTGSGDDSYWGLSDNTTAFSSWATKPEYAYFFINGVPEVAVNSAAYPLTVNPMTAVGDLIIGSTGGSPARLGAGTENYVLTANGAGVAPSWKAVAGGGDVSSGGTTSAAQEMAVFSDTGEKTLGRSYFVLAGPATTAKTYTFPNANSTMAAINQAATWTGVQTLGTTTALQFRDSAIHIASLDDGHLDLTADTSIDLNGAVVTSSTANLSAGAVTLGAIAGTVTMPTGSIAFGADPADSGAVRLSNNTALAFEQSTPGTDIFIALDGSDILQVGQNCADIRLGTSGTGNVTVTGDLTITGNDITFGNAETISNATNGTIAITAPLTTVSGNFGLYSANDPDLTAEGQVAWDANGDVLRGHDGTRQVAIGRAMEEIHVTVVKPNDLDDATRDKFPFWSNDSGMPFVVTAIEVWSDVDSSVVSVVEYAPQDLSSAAETTEASIDTGTTGTSVANVTVTSIDHDTVQDGNMLFLDFDDTDVPGWVKVTVRGYYAADVN